MTPEEVVDKFKPWFPHLRAIPIPDKCMPVMTPREALMILEDDAQNLYDGGSGNHIAGHAFGVLEDLVEKDEWNHDNNSASIR